MLKSCPSLTSRNMSAERISVRPACSEDEDAIIRICLETAYEGKSAADRLTIPELPALVWALPYISMPTGFGFVMVEQGTSDTPSHTEHTSSDSKIPPKSRNGDKIVGYVVGTSDTAAYETAAEEHWWPVLRAAYPHACSEPNHSEVVGDEMIPGHDHLTELDKHYLSLILTGTHAPHDVLAFAGATLHIDILPEYQGKGWGRRLMQLAVTQLARRGAQALWVGSNGEEGRRFYRKVGFRPIRDKFMGLRFDDFKAP